VAVVVGVGVVAAVLEFASRHSVLLVPLRLIHTHRAGLGLCGDFAALLTNLVCSYCI
jgi:hypothetical protein